MHNYFPIKILLIISTCVLFAKSLLAQNVPIGNSKISNDKGIVEYFPALLKPSFSKLKRGVWVYTPPGYDHASIMRYPVIYMHDGQNLFDSNKAFNGEWGIDEAIDSLVNAGEAGSIVIGIENSEDRIKEYKPYDSEQYGASLANDYLLFITEVVKPYVDSIYKTKPNAANTMIAGSSMGGLISYYAAIKYSEIFGKAGFFSPSFWIEQSLIELQPRTIFTSENKYFFYMGEKEGDENLELNEAYATNMALMGKSIICLYTLPEAEHNEKSCRAVFPIFYKWMMATGANVLLPTD